MLQSYVCITQHPFLLLWFEPYISHTQSKRDNHYTNTDRQGWVGGQGCLAMAHSGHGSLWQGESRYTWLARQLSFAVSGCIDHTDYGWSSSAIAGPCMELAWPGWMDMDGRYGASLYLCWLTMAGGTSNVSSGYKAAFFRLAAMGAVLLSILVTILDLPI